MNGSDLRYQPDEWAHDLDQWWVPLAGLAAQADCTSSEWLSVLGVEEFFDKRLLAQPRVLTPWLCLTAATVAAAAARSWAQIDDGRQAPDGTGRDVAELAASALSLAVVLQRHRWSGHGLGEGITSTPELIESGKAALSFHGHTAAASNEPIAVHLVAGWLSCSGAEIPAAGPVHNAAIVLPEPESSAVERARNDPGQRAIAALANALGGGPLTWATAHLAERLAAATLDPRPELQRPDDPPAQAWANVLLAAKQGHVGRFEARRQSSLLAVPPATPVPDLARMAFLHASDDFVSSIADAFTAADTVTSLGRPGQLITWSLQLRGGQHPVAERSVSGPSAGLGAYVTFRSLAQLGLFPDREAAFTGQVSPRGQLRAVGSASDKVAAAAGHRVLLVIHPSDQRWQDPAVTVELRAAERAEDALIAVTQQLRGLRSYLEAACQLVAPEPWLQAWLDNQGGTGHSMPLLTMMCRHLSPPHDAATGRNVPVPAETPPGAAARRPKPSPGGQGENEPVVPPCPAHLLACSYPDYSFAISADPGGGSTMTAKRITAEAARRALDRLRSPGWEEPQASITLPLYLPLGNLPATWDELVRISVDALPATGEPSLDVAAALAGALRAGHPHRCRALVVIDGSDRSPRNSSQGQGRERGFIALVTGTGETRRATQPWWGWRPARPAQVVLCGRTGSPFHLNATEALRLERLGTTVTMVLDPLTGDEIDRFTASLPRGPRPLAGAVRDLAANPLLLTLSVIAGGRDLRGSDQASSADLFDRGITVLLGKADQDRRFLAEIAFRAAVARGVPAGVFTLSDLADPEAKQAVAAALAVGDAERAWAMALSQDERNAFERAANDSHLLTASGNGWRLFHDRAFAFLVADRIARRAAEDDAPDDEAFGILTPHLGDPPWGDVIEAVGRLLELHAPAAPGRP